jgi:hypothetical protein
LDFRSAGRGFGGTNDAGAYWNDKGRITLLAAVPGEPFQILSLENNFLDFLTQLSICLDKLPILCF